MPLANCNLSTLQAAAKCFDCLSSTEKQALIVRFMAEALKAVGGPDLTNVNTRNSTVQCLNCVPDFTLESMETAVWLSIAQKAGASLPSTINGLKALVKCDVCGPKNDSAYLYLLCQIGQRTIS